MCAGKLTKMDHLIKQMERIANVLERMLQERVADSGK